MYSYPQKRQMELQLRVGDGQGKIFFRRFLVGFTAAFACFTAIACQQQLNPSHLNTTSASRTKNIFGLFIAKTDVNTVVEGNNAFALDLYSQLRKEKGNLFFSPYSLSTALAMTYAGAKGETATEMAKVLHFNLEPERLHPGFATLIGDMNPGNHDQYQLIQANRLWGQKGYGFLNTFLKVTKDNYGAGLEQVDFNAREKTTRTINDWVAKQTQNKIQDILAPGSIDSNTRLVLTNAIYFKGTWRSQFQGQHTSDRPFNVTATQQVNFPMMGQISSFQAGYTEVEGLQVLEMPYVGDRISMIILLPEKIDGLTELEQQLTPKNLQKWLRLLSHPKVAIVLPKFKIESSLLLKPLLSEMGMPLAFSSQADFSTMNKKEKLFISEVIQKTVVAVDEEGTEATAATAVPIRTLGSDRSQKKIKLFLANHPFIFLIRDRQSDSILFLGRVVNPLK
ncbi:MAG TPA: serpin family protein [Stenomitos sp.]